MLLWADGHFVLSRNFRLQKIGDLDWLNTNYGFRSVSRFIDELVILNVSRDSEVTWPDFLKHVTNLAQNVFAPIAVGGFGQRLDRAAVLLRSGADKLVINRAFFFNRPFVEAVVERFGRQCVTASIDLRNSAQSGAEPYFPQETLGVGHRELADWQVSFPLQLCGEVMVRSVDRDGTGLGLDLDLYSGLPGEWYRVPIVAAGGVGKPEHIVSGLSNPILGAVATANLLNFVGSGLEKARAVCTQAGIDLAHWI